ncbi:MULTISPECIES: AsmA family protein [unclassified Anaeromyxobacter]|uniref:AsmA family protein n=1 Tax=unclassified Anaeromyxobacter TaxID=2620896 RepID=UPI001F59A51E|nr:MULTISPECIES: AsmA family protein [unclassified Anaeromyxobacter]
MATGGRPVARRLLLIAGAAAGLLVLLVAALLLLVDSAAVTRRVADLVLSQASRALGREVAVTTAKLHLLPEARVALRGLTVAGRAGEPGLVAAESLDVHLGLWPLLRSLGKDVEVRSVVLVKPTVNLVRAKDGTWNYEGLGEGKPETAAEPAQAAGAATRVVVERVRIEGAAIRLVDRSAGRDDAGVALEQLDLEATGVGPGLPFEVRVAAAFASAQQNLHAQLSVDHLPDGVPRRPEDWPLITGGLQIGALPLDRFRALLPAELGALVRGGTATLEAKVTTGEGRAYKVDGSGALKDVRLRGQPASGHFRALATWSPARPAASRVDLTELTLRGPGVDLGGHASVATPPLAAWFVVTGSLLDLDAVMGLLPEKAEAAPPRGGDLVPAAMRERLRAASVRGTVALAEVRSGRLQAKNVKARVSLVKGVLTVEELDAAVFGGRVSGAGTHIALGEKVPTWRLAAKLSALDLGGALQAFAGAQPLTGKLDGTLDVVGKGTDWAKLRQALTGLAALAVKDGALVTTDLGDAVLGGVARGLEQLGRGRAAREVSGAKGRTEFKNLAGEFDVKDGFLVARAPVTVDTPFGKLALGGRVGLDGRLALEGTSSVPKAALARVVPGGLPLPQMLEVPLALGGTLESPSVSVRADTAVANLARGEAHEAVKGARKQVERGRDAVEGLLKGFGGKR